LEATAQERVHCAAANRQVAIEYVRVSNISSNNMPYLSILHLLSRDFNVLFYCLQMFLALYYYTHSDGFHRHSSIYCTKDQLRDA